MVGERSWLVLLAVLFLSSVVDSQVIIRERAAIEPKAPAADGRPVSSRSATDLYFSPPLFVGGPTLTLTSTLTISGEIDIQGAIGGNQHVVIVVVLSGGSEHSVARKGREPIWWGGEMYEENDPYTGVFGKGPAPNVQMYLFDGSWGRASRQVRVTESGLEVEFEGYLQQGTFPAVRVRGRATITGEIVATSRFAGWIVRIAQGKARCGEPGYLQWAPVDGAGGWYQPAGIAIWGVSVMLSVEGEGPYVVLRYREEEEGEIIRWEEGQQISYTYRQLAEGRSEVWVVVDPSRGGRPVPGEVARVRLSGGGRSGMVEVPLECDGGLEHFEVTVDKDTVEYGTTAALRVQAKDREGNDVELDDGELIRMMLRPAVIAGSVKGGSDLKGEMASFKVEGSSGGGKYGSFIVEGSEPVADEVEVGYGVVRQGKVRYLADGGVASGSEPEEVMIVAELVEDETKNGWTVVVVRRMQNRPPVITSVAFNPARRYFAYGSDVSVGAEAIDPDGDAVTISYLPGSTFTLTTFGAVAVTITATDSKGASTARTETIYSIAVGITPSRDRIIDGGNINYRVFIAPQGIAASSFQWEGNPADPNGGNNPSVVFQPSNMVQQVTITSARWYASPNDECGARAEATYLLKNAVVFNGDEFQTQEARMIVYVPERGGGTNPPFITGWPGIAALRNGRGHLIKVRVDNLGTLRRTNPTSRFFLPQTSQFYEKIKAHEDEHVRQFQTGVAKQLWSVELLFKRLRNLESVSEMLLEQKINTEIAKFNEDQKDLYRKLWNQMEIGAYFISDPIPPRYFYQRCGRTTFPKP